MLAEAIGAAHPPAGGADATPVRCATVSAGPADHAADMEGEVGRWKVRGVRCNRHRHKPLIACRIGSRQGVLHCVAQPCGNAPGCDRALVPSRARKSGVQGRVGGFECNRDVTPTIGLAFG